jgi:hypothetical protein
MSHILSLRFLESFLSVLYCNLLDCTHVSYVDVLYYNNNLSCYITSSSLSILHQNKVAEPPGLTRARMQGTQYLHSSNVSKIFAWPWQLPMPLPSLQDKYRCDESMIKLNTGLSPSASAFLFAAAASRSARIFARRDKSALAWSVLPWTCS